MKDPYAVVDWACPKCCNSALLGLGLLKPKLFLAIFFRTVVLKLWRVAESPKS